GRLAPCMRLNRNDLVGARIDHGDIFEARRGGVAEIAGVGFQEANAGESVLELLPLQDLRRAGAEHFELRPERRVFRIAGDIASGLRFLDHPTRDWLAENATLLGGHLLLEAL